MLGGCRADPDWQSLYSERLGQAVTELDDSTIEQEFVDPVEHGSLTRAAWAKLKNGDLVLLGLPAHGQKDVQTVVEKTVVLNQEEWQGACRSALGEKEIQSWRLPHQHLGNSIRIYLNDQNDAYCEFFYLPDGWELRTVHSQGIVKSAR
jgi:hypothetical protein